MTPKVIVFDAYGTLFDIAAAARRAAAEPGHGALAAQWPGLSEDWRRKQLEYTWLRSLMGAYADFAQVTAEALDWALAARGLTDPGLRARLLDLYDDLDPFPEARPALSTLRSRGHSLAILSNGTPAMLARAASHAGVDGLLAAVISVDAIATYKPHPATYSLVEARLGATPAETLFVSSNGWDIAGAGQFGFATVWINRSDAPPDRLPRYPGHILRDLSGLPDLVA